MSVAFTAEPGPYRAVGRRSSHEESARVQTQAGGAGPGEEVAAGEYLHDTPG